MSSYFGSDATGLLSFELVYQVYSRGKQTLDETVLCGMQSQLADRVPREDGSRVLQTFHSNAFAGMLPSEFPHCTEYPILLYFWNLLESPKLTTS